MVLVTKVVILLARSTGQELSSGLMARCLWGSSRTTIYMGRAFISGATEESTQASGNSIKCMEPAPSSGAMGGSILANTAGTRSTASVSFSGQTVVNTKVIGKTESTTARVLSYLPKELKSTVSGRMASAPSGYHS